MLPLPCFTMLHCTLKFVCFYLCLITPKIHLTFSCLHIAFLSFFLAILPYCSQLYSAVEMVVWCTLTPFSATALFNTFKVTTDFIVTSFITGLWPKIHFDFSVVAVCLIYFLLCIYMICESELNMRNIPQHSSNFF